MRILIVEPEQAPEVADITGSLPEMQQIVGGLIQAVYPFPERVALICNEEGKMLGLPRNRGLRDGLETCMTLSAGHSSCVGCRRTAITLPALHLNKSHNFRSGFSYPKHS